MNLQRPDAKEAMQTANRSRSGSSVSGICTRCTDRCRGNCETFHASFRGWGVSYPGPFGIRTTSGDKHHPIDYSHLDIVGRTLGTKREPQGQIGYSDKTLFPVVNTETQYGVETKVKMRLPIFIGAPGLAEIDCQNWEHFATGAAIAGITIVCGENVCGTDPGLELDSNGRVSKAPNLVQRVEQYRRCHEGYGDMIVQMNVEDIRLGVAEYVVDQLGIECIELKWGRGVKGLGDEIRIDSLEGALELQKRGYLVTPDPSNPGNQAAFRAGVLKRFERHSRLGFIDEDGFMKQVERMRGLGAKRVTLKTGACPVRELTLAIQWASDARLDLLTIDGGAGGTGVSPWRMVEDRGVPTFCLQSMAHDLCRKLVARNRFVPDIAIAGGFSSEDHVFKVLALGAPYTKAVCIGRTLMVPGMVGKDIGLWLAEGPDIPRGTIAQFGLTVEEIFVCYEGLAAKYGKETARKLPLGAVVLCTYADKMKAGLQQLMAGSRNFNLSTISRDDLTALTPEAAEVSGIAQIIDACSEQTEKIINR